MIPAFIKDGMVYTLASLITRGLNLFLIPLYTHILSPADYGSFDLILLLASVVNIVITFEISQGVARFYTAEIDAKKKVIYASTAFWFTLICYTAFLIFSLLLSQKISSAITGQPGMELAFQVGIIYIFVNGIFYLIQNQLRWELRSFQYAIISVTMALISAGVSIWLVLILQWGLVGLLVGMLSGSSVAAILGILWLRNSFGFIFSTTLLNEMLTYSTPLVFSSISVWVSLYVDRVMINHFLSIEDVGIYGVGFRIASIAGLVMIGIQSALTPLIYAHYQNPETPTQVEKIFRIFLFLALLMFLFLTLFATDIFAIMTTSEFYGASTIVVFLVPAILLGNMYIFSPGIAIAKKTHLIVWINAVGGLTNLGLNYWLIPIFGIAGAGMATMLSYGGIFAAYTLIGQRLYRIPHNWIPIFAAVGLAALIAAMLSLWHLPNHVRWMVNVFSMIGFSLIAVVLKLVKSDEIYSACRFISQRISFKV